MYIAQHAAPVPLNGLDNIFKSERLVYRPLEDNSDHRNFLEKEIWSDPATMAYGTPFMLGPTSKQRGEERVHGMTNAKNWLVCLVCLPPLHENQAPTPIGFVALSNSSSQHIRVATLSICIISSYQSKGYGTETLNWVTDWAFSFANVHRLDLSVNSFNSRAIQLYKRLGYKEEGRRRELVFLGNQYYDLIDMSILRREWSAKK